MHVRASYALGIVTLFPYLQDPYSKHGYVSVIVPLKSKNVLYNLFH